MRYCPLEERNTPPSRRCSEWELHCARKRNNPMKYISVRIARAVLALVLIGHALIHLGIIRGGMQEPDGRTGWSGASWLLDHVLSTPVIWTIAVVLVAGTILFFVAGGLGLVGIPLLKRQWKAETIVACSLSLLLFAVTWTGLLPHPTDAVFGPVISGVVLVGLLIDLLLEHTVLRLKPKLVEHRGLIAHADR